MTLLVDDVDDQEVVCGESMAKKIRLRFDGESSNCENDKNQIKSH